MIGLVSGTVAEIDGDLVTVECGPVGINVVVPSDYPYAKFGIGDEVRLYTHMSVREDDISLFGFLSREDKKAYELLLTVSGVGPRAGMGILSQMDAAALQLAVLTDDAASIAKAPGIGKKTAQKIILELKDKFSLTEAFESKLAGSSQAAVQSVSAEQDEIRKEAVEALTALGYNSTEALRAVSSVPEASDVESLLKAALRRF